jgi:hypothetical protein
MAVDNFTVGATVTTTDNFVDVTQTPGTVAIPQGTHHFQLIVVDEAGNKSAPVTAAVVIKDTVLPTAVLTIAPTQVQPGATFRLDGSKSSDVAPGTVVQFIWTMID